MSTHDKEKVHRYSHDRRCEWWSLLKMNVRLPFYFLKQTSSTILIDFNLVPGKKHIECTYYINSTL